MIGVAQQTGWLAAGLGVMALGVAEVGLTAPVWAQGTLPDRNRTPGAINPAVTPATIADTICRRGWTRTVRPPKEYTSGLKREQLRAWGYGDRRLGHYEEDHLVPLGLGGAPTDPRNLWPEPRKSADGWDAGRKDDLEFALNQLVCSGRLPLAQAQAAIATDWIAAYRTTIGQGGSAASASALAPALEGSEP